MRFTRFAFAAVPMVCGPPNVWSDIEGRCVPSPNAVVPGGPTLGVNQMRRACSQMPNHMWDEAQSKCVPTEMPRWLPYALVGFGVIMVAGLAIDAWRVSKGLAAPGTGTIVFGGRSWRT